jgi:hypothetical protein
MYRHITEHVTAWSKVLQSPSDLQFKRLNGNSNACFKVSLKDHIVTPDSVSRAVLYRRYEQKVIDKNVEQAIFLAKSEDKTGPALYVQNDSFRIEEFYEGRPITLWEMRNPLIQEKYAEQICHFNFNKLANKYVHNVMPLDQKNLFIHQVI